MGVLNFVNAVLTGIITRKREFAVLQAIGMTGRQLKTMLMLEGLLYTLLSIIFSLLLSLILSPVLGGAVEQMFWFFSYRFTVWPVLLIAPVFVLLGLLIPLLTYRLSPATRLWKDLGMGNSLQSHHPCKNENQDRTIHPSIHFLSIFCQKKSGAAGNRPAAPLLAPAG